MHELALSPRDRRHGRASCRGPARDLGADAHRRAATGRARLARVLLRDRRRAETACEGARLEHELVTAQLACADLRGDLGSGRSRVPEVPVPDRAGQAATSCGGMSSRSKSSRRSRRRTRASHQGESGRGRPRRQRDHRARQSRRLRSRIRAGGQPDERPGRRQDLAAGAGARRPRRSARRRARGRRSGQPRRRPDRRSARPRHPAQHRPRVRRRMPPRRQHGPLGDPLPPAGRNRPAGDRERRQPRLPGGVPGR